MKFHLINSYLRIPLFYRILLTGGSFILLFGLLIHLVEPTTYRTIFDGIWWAIVTTSTIGYGDFVPETTAGKFVAILLILLGTGFISAYFVTLSAAAISKENALINGTLAYEKEGHTIIIGWNERVRELLSQLTKLRPFASFVIIDETLDKLPISNKNVHFIKGNPTYEHVLHKANIAKAKTVLITANQHKNEMEADMAAILTLLTMKGLNPHIYAIIEILTAHQVNNAKRAGADEIIQTNLLSSFMMLNSVLSSGLSQVVEHLLERLKVEKLQLIDVPDNLIGKTFKQGHEMFWQQQTLLLGIIREGESYLNPPPHFVIEKHDQLFILKH
ncbi:voltage-gated potassium channel [Anoxybacillus vitaminiphilus]|uniref:Voltage-gated potassium channel n=1 Tax=Paranoxybacillus vitaminiphilus TaxID=581036 RepID=A0A327YK88_9BACL|nr:potassium channel protein [Anoxybacillus vitaminiphilus]RAK18699.1 voltage-gated potassium channel [Anoxybacillus vitaminiphilus]